ncbi:3-keto-5-aminohexanoate cleavage protein [Burkholderia glumae]|uniref:3-keto-5-aminohexanoate cleavage protein n=1 Tax=Burkholderia glumae TaxID=337 RepID=UPI0002D5D0ED|nr:3-keto-5-aminohexanoate cleavage protein [Burkholderia glumae]
MFVIIDSIERGPFMTSLYITAAPIGAVPKFLDPFEATFIPSFLLEGFFDADRCASIAADLKTDGWEVVPAGGRLLQVGHAQPIDERLLAGNAQAATIRQALEAARWTRRDGAWHPPRLAAPNAAHFPKPWLAALSNKLARRIVLQLTTYGWIVSEQGDLLWEHERQHHYLPPALIEAIEKESPALLKNMEEAGWIACAAGYWQAGKARSPYLPITPEAITEETIRSMRAGAAVVHLHTRDLSDRRRIEIPGLGVVTVGSQRNQIVLDDYDAIVPMVKKREPAAILNLSTSVRGDRHGARSKLRRAHLKFYDDVGSAPEVASLSPAAVVFQGGGGYDNAPDFLDAQFDHFERVGTRPEVEVFNHAIVDNATSLYRDRLLRTGKPVLFMLVAGVDQYRRDPITGEVEDDSLIARVVREEISSLLADESADSHRRAVELAIGQLRPVVERLRASFPVSKISILLPGPMQNLLVDVALGLGLDGIRVGLEDGLTVNDARVPGGVRKARGTWEQVSLVREELLGRGATILTAAQVRDMFGLGIKPAARRERDPQTAAG